MPRHHTERAPLGLCFPQGETESPRRTCSSLSIVCHFPGSSFRSYLTKIVGRMCWADYWRSDCDEEGQGLYPATRTWILADLVPSHGSIQVEIPKSSFSHLQSQDESPVQMGNLVYSTAWFGTPNAKSCWPSILFCYPPPWAGTLLHRPAYCWM